MPDSNLVHMQTPAPLRNRDYDAKQMMLIKRTVAADTTPDEFDMFVTIAQRAGLDPFRRQLYCVVYNKDEPAKRKVSFITGIDGFRAVAARNGNYRPDDEEPQFTTDESLQGPSNPRGLVKAVVKAFKRDGNEWFPVVGVAYWTEFAPMKQDVEGGFDWVDTGEKWADSGKPKKRKVPRVEGAETVSVPSGKWADMPFVMLAKCAESQALRKGWPEDLSGIYSPEEMDKPLLDVTPTDAIAQHAQSERLKLVGATNAVPILWKVGEPIQYVPAGKLGDEAAKYIKDSDLPAELKWWWETNAAGFREFWAISKSDGLGVKKLYEERMKALEG